MTPETRTHVLSFVEPELLRMHLHLGHGVTTEADHREMDLAHIEAHEGAADHGEEAPA